MEESTTNKFIKVISELEKIDGTFQEITITLTEDGLPQALAFFDIDKTLAELKNVHGLAIRALFKELYDKDFEGIEEIYFKGFRLGNSFREFDRMDGIYNLGHTEWIDPIVYIKERLNYKIKEIDNEGFGDHKLAQMYLDRYVQIASNIADQIYKDKPEEFESVKIKPVFTLVKLYKTLGIPMFGMTANGEKLTKTIAKYLNLSDYFIDIATDEDMVGGGKELVIPKLINQLKEKGVKVPKDKLVIVGDSLYGDIGSGLRFKETDQEIEIKGILVLKDQAELKQIRTEIKNDKNLQKIIKNTDTEAFVFSEVRLDQEGIPIIIPVEKNFLVKL